MVKKKNSFFLFLILHFSFADDTFYYDTFCNNGIARLFARMKYHDVSDSYCERLQYKNIFTDINSDKINSIRDQHMLSRILRDCETSKEEFLKCFEKIDFPNVSTDIYVEFLIRKGLCYISNGLFEDAISIFNQLKGGVEEEQTLLLVNFYISLCCFYLGRYDESSSILFEMYRCYDNLDPMFLYLLTISLYHNNKSDELFEILAEEKMKKLLDVHFKYRGFMYIILGDIFLSRNEYEKALDSYYVALDSNLNIQHRDLLMLKIAFSKYMNGGVDDSLDIFLGLTSLRDVVGSIASFYVGYIYLQRREYDKSLEFFTRVYELGLMDDDGIPEALFYCGVCNFILGKNDEALRLLEAFTERYKDHPLFDTVGRLIVEINVPDYNYTKIMSSLGEGTNDDASIVLISQREYFYKAVECYEKGEYENCFEYCLKSMEYGDDNNIRILNVLLCGEACYNLKRYGDAIKYFEEFLSNPILEYKQHVLFILAFCFYSLGNYEKALESFLQIDLCDMPVDVGVKIAHCFFNLERYKEAAGWYSKYVDNDTFYLFRYGLSLFLSGDKESARRVFGIIIKNRHSSSFFNDALGFYYKCLEGYSFEDLYADDNLTVEMIVEELSKKDSVLISNIDVLDDIYKVFRCEDDALAEDYKLAE